jgi:hypothetical protein
LFKVSRFAGPAGSVVRSFNQKQIIDIQDITNENPIYEVEVRYHCNDVVMTEDQVASAIKGTVNWTQWTKPYLTKIATDATLRTRYEGKGGRRLVLETALALDDEAQTLANNVLALVKGYHTGYKVTLNLSGYQGLLGDTEGLSFAYQDGTIVLGLDGNDRYVLISTIDQAQNGKIIHDLYGPEV